MTDDQVNAEELTESRRLRKAAENATDDGMQVGPEDKERDAEGNQYGSQKQWVRLARKWLGARSGFMRS